jgi:hypothetical protein
VHEILKRLSAEARVLDLGCAHGSFPDADCPGRVFRCDLDFHAGMHSTRFVCCDAASLPFADSSFDAVILNHSLEHFGSPETVLAEVGRVIRDRSHLWIAVPDASTITDRLYRWLGRVGGHVNRFSDIAALVQLIRKQSRMEHVGTRLLFTSFSFMNRRNILGRKPRRLYLLGGGSETILRAATLLLRKMDALIGTRTSVYGWACCFGSPVPFDPRPWSNVCVRCGAGHPSELLLKLGRVRRGRLGVRLFQCPGCGAQNYFTDDAQYLSMR